MGMKPQKKEIPIDNKCVFALCNQRGPMEKMIGNQKYCMVIQNMAFENNQGVPEVDPEGKFIDQQLWDEHGYEQVCNIPKHSCNDCAFFLPVELYKLVPSKLKVRYAFTVERRDDFD